LKLFGILDPAFGDRFAEQRSVGRIIIAIQCGQQVTVTGLTQRLTESRAVVNLRAINVVGDGLRVVARYSLREILAS
jgi:hypothetical protein